MTDVRMDATATAPVSAARLAIGFAAGFVAVLVFHQLMLGLLYLLGVAGRPPFNMAGVPPFGVPAVLSAAFWGGLWGILFAVVEPRFPRGAKYWIAAFLFGAIPLTLVAWFIVLPLKGLPVGGGWKAAGMATALLVNGAWGIGTGLLFRLLARGNR